MAQSTSGTHLTTTAAASVRRPCCVVKIDWARAGWASEASWTDETERVVSVSIQHQVTDARRGIALLGNSIQGTARLVLANDDDRYTPDNPSSPLHSYIADGKAMGIPVKIYLGFYYGSTPETLVQFSGYIRQPTIAVARGEATLELADRSWDLAQFRLETIPYSYYPDDYIELLLAELPSARQPTADLDRGLYPLAFAWMDGESIWEELTSVAVAQGGLVWFGKDGTLYFRDGTFPALNTASVETITEAIDGRVLYREGDIFNHIRVSWSSGRRERLTEVWRYNGCLGPIRPGASETVKASLGMLVSNLTAPAWDTDYKAVSATWEELESDDVTVAITKWSGQKAELTVTNNASASVYVPYLRLRGWPVDFQDEETVEEEDATSIGLYGRRTLDVRLLYVQGKGHAESVAKFLLARYKDPRATYQLTIRALPWLEVGDRITLNVPRKAIEVMDNADYFIIGLGQEFRPGDYIQTLMLLKASDILPYNDWHVVGTTAMGSGRWYY